MAGSTTGYAPQTTTTTPSPGAIAPSAAHGPGTMMHGAKTETYDSASPEVKALIRQLNKLANAKTLEEHQAALQGFDEDVILDTPFLQVQGRERIRILSALSKFFLGTFEIEPKLVKITVPEGAATKGGKLEVDGIVHWLPHRPWYLPLTLLLPRDIPIYSDVSLGIKAHNDKVFFVSGKNHNLPHVPRLLRVVAGWFAGMAVSVAEPAVLNIRDWFNAGVENVSSVTHMGRDTTTTTGGMGYTSTETGVLGAAKETAAKTVHTVRDTAASVIESASEKMAAVGKAAETFASKVTTAATGGGHQTQPIAA